MAEGGAYEDMKELEGEQILSERVSMSPDRQNVAVPDLQTSTTTMTTTTPLGGVEPPYLQRQGKVDYISTTQTPLTTTQNFTSMGLPYVPCAVNPEVTMFTSSMINQPAISNIYTQAPIIQEQIFTPSNVHIANDQLYNMFVAQQQYQVQLNKFYTDQIHYLTDTVNKLTQTVADLMVTRTQRVIPPGKYRPDGGEPLFVFLQRYEEYCKATYTGSERGMTFLLEEHLEGSILQVYQLALQNSLEYQQIKKQLLNWEKTQIKRKEERFAQDYETITRGAKETIAIYAMRFITIAERAFPGSDVRKLPTVREKFIATLPAHIQMNVKSAISTIETVMNIPVSWDKLIAIIEKNMPSNVQETSEVSYTVTPPVIHLDQTVGGGCFWAPQQVPQQLPMTFAQKVKTNSPPKQNIQAVPNQHAKSQINNQQGFVPNSPINTQGSSGSQKTHNTNNNNNNNNNGKSHNNTNKYNNKNNNNNYNNGTNSNSPRTKRNKTRTASPSVSSSQSSDDTLERCNYCKKDGHNISNCLLRPYCLFCGNRGHTSEKCYSALNKCVRCEIEGHIIDDCPKNKRVIYNANLECPLCNGAHLGKDCRMKLKLN